MNSLFKTSLLVTLFIPSMAFAKLADTSITEVSQTKMIDPQTKNLIDIAFTVEALEAGQENIYNCRSAFKAYFGGQTWAGKANCRGKTYQGKGFVGPLGAVLLDENNLSAYSNAERENLQKISLLINEAVATSHDQNDTSEVSKVAQ